MENDSSFNQPTKTLTPTFVAVAVIGVVVGILIGGTVSLKLNNSTDDTPPTPLTIDKTSANYQAGFEAARARLVERGVIPKDINNQNIETLSIRGTVKKVSDNTLIVEVPSIDILGDATTRTVTVTADTALYQLMNKTTEVMEAEMKEYIAKLSRQNSGEVVTENFIEPPKSSIQEKITMQSIKEGGLIIISAESPIPASGDITADTIEIYSLPHPIEVSPSRPNE